MTQEDDKKPCEIQLAIQGGGAKVVGLIAALEAVQELERKNLIKVTRIAATSAGAIAGALYAGGVPMAAVRTYLTTLDTRPFAAPGKVEVAWRVLSNQPIFDSGLVRSALCQLFNNGDIVRMTLKDFADAHIPIHITATDVTNSRSYALGPEDSKNIIDAVMDSAAVPFLFRAPTAHDTGSTMADGGVCENLPVAPLKQHELVDGPIVAISFAPPAKAPERPTNLVTYIAALVSAAIDNSVARAKRDIKWTLELKLDVPSFSFESSLKSGLDKYELLKEQAANFFQKVIEGYRRERVDTDPWSASTAASNQWEKDLSETMRQVGWMYRVHHLPNTPRIATSQLIVTAHSLERTGAADGVINVVELHARDAPVYCYRFALTGLSDDTDLLHSDVGVSDSAGNAIPFRNLPMMDYESDAMGTARALLVIFQTPLTRENGPYTVRLVEEVKGFVKGLLDDRRKEDEAYISTKLAQLDSASIVVHWAKSFGALTHRGEVREQGGEGRVMANCSCRELTPGKLNGFYPPPGRGYRTIGWVCDGVPAPAKFTVRLFAP